MSDWILLTWKGSMTHNLNCNKWVLFYIMKGWRLRSRSVYKDKSLFALSYERALRHCRYPIPSSSGNLSVRRVFIPSCGTLRTVILSTCERQLSKKPLQSVSSQRPFKDNTRAIPTYYKSDWLDEEISCIVTGINAICGSNHNEMEHLGHFCPSHVGTSVP